MNYPYANGTIKVLETNILDRNKLSKLLKLNQKDFLKTLIELGYGSSDCESIEEIITYEMVATKQQLEHISPDLSLTNLFYFANDALNIKALYKMKIFGIKHLDIFHVNGTIDKEVLEKVVFEEEYSLVSKELGKLFTRINSEVTKLTNPRLISAKIDQLLFDYVLKQNRNQTLRTYFEALIDFANVLTFVRSHNLNWDESQFLEMYIDGGKIKKNHYLNLYTSAKDELIYNFNEFYLEDISKGLKVYFEKHDLNQLEKYFDTLLLKIMSEFKNDSFNIGPIIYYYLIKQLEAKNIRLIYANSFIESSDLLEY
jgi:vacuolar-type H+-ATPase subunit C/Vma6